MASSLRALRRNLKPTSVKRDAPKAAPVNVQPIAPKTAQSVPPASSPFNPFFSLKARAPFKILAATTIASLAANPMVTAVKSNLMHFIANGSEMVAPAQSFVQQAFNYIASPITQAAVAATDKFASLSNGSLKILLLNGLDNLNLSSDTMLKVINATGENADILGAVKTAYLASDVFAAQPAHIAMAGAAVGLTAAAAVYAFKAAKKVVVGCRAKRAARAPHEKEASSLFGFVTPLRVSLAALGLLVATAPLFGPSLKATFDDVRASLKPAAETAQQSTINLHPMSVVEKSNKAPESAPVEQVAAQPAAPVEPVTAQSTTPSPWMTPSDECRTGYSDPEVPYHFVSIQPSGVKTKHVPARYAKIVPQKYYKDLSKETQSLGDSKSRTDRLAFMLRAHEEMRGKATSADLYKLTVAMSKHAFKSQLYKPATNKDPYPFGLHAASIRAKAEFDLFIKSGKQIHLQQAIGNAVLGEHLSLNAKNTPSSVSVVLAYAKSRQPEMLATARTEVVAGLEASKELAFSPSRPSGEPGKYVLQSSAGYAPNTVILTAPPVYRTVRL